MSSAAGADSIDSVVMFTSGVTEQFYPIPIVDNNNIESTEIFTASLSTNESYVYINDDTAAVTVLDDERKLLTIFPSKYNENSCVRAALCTAILHSYSNLCNLLMFTAFSPVYGYCLENAIYSCDCALLPTGIEPSSSNNIILIAVIISLLFIVAISVAVNVVVCIVRSKKKKGKKSEPEHIYEILSPTTLAGSTKPLAMKTNPSHSQINTSN